MKSLIDRKILIAVTYVLAVVALAASYANAAQVKLDAAIANPTLLADQKQTTFLKVGLTGFAWMEDKQRPPVNVAIVIDKSGSMTGEKIAKAKEAAIMAVDRLSGKDIVSVVAYDHNVTVLVPATKVADKDAIKAGISRLSAGGNTALFAGVSKGAAEVRKFLEKDLVSRIILISDGLANVGPSSPDQLGDLGTSLIKEGISVTTVGLGLDYNEDLMTRLAQKSDGNHYFARTATDLAQIFKTELGDVLSVCAQEVTITIKCADGIRPVRVLGREADITGQNVMAVLNQLYSEQEKFVLLEVEVPATAEDEVRKVASVSVSYANMATKTSETLTSTVDARFTRSQELVEKKTSKDVMVAAVELIAVETSKRALELRDAGKVDEAKAALVHNAAYLEENAKKYGSAKLEIYGTINVRDASNLEADDWKATRKSMREEQTQRDMQQSSQEGQQSDK